MLATAFSATAAPVDAQKAMRAAQNYMALNGGEGISLVDITATTPFNEFYIFEGTDGRGFVLVAGDDCVLPILGFSATSPFVCKNMPAQIKEWLEDCEAQIRFYREHASPLSTAHSIDASAAAAWERLLDGQQPQPPSSTSVSPLLNTTWAQDPLYNSLCPYDYSAGEYTVTGCVATATAQVMKYWNHPATGYGSHSYASDYGSLSANFGTTTYAWSSMPNALTSSSSSAQVNAVAKLMYHIGVALEMEYGVSAVGGSGAVTYYDNDPTNPTAENILKRYFKYKSSLHHIRMADYTAAQWNAMLVNELINGRPVIYAGRDASGGHCFVCDGVNNSGLFHFNWGWGGYCDGYYAIGNLHPAAGGTGGNVTYTFNMDNAAVIGIEPNNNFSGTTSVTAVPNNVSYGSVTGSGTYSGTNTSTVALTAAAASGCRFTQWSDGYKYNNRNFLANGGTYSFTANFEPLAGDTLGYCSGDILTAYGASGTTTWGIKIPASALAGGRTLAKVQLYVAAAGSYTVNIYSGTSAPTTTLLTQNFSANSSSVGNWGTLTLSSPVTTDGTQSLWIAFSSTASYPAAVTYYCGNNDSRLWGSSLSPNNSIDYSFMIRGIFDHSSAPSVQGDTLSYCGNSTYDNAVGTGNGLTWGIKFPISTLAGRSSVSDVLIFIPPSGAGTYQLNIYQGNNPTTSNQIAQMSSYFGSAAEESWQNFHFSSPVNISNSSPLWVTFTNNNTQYPAAYCPYTGDTNSCLLTLDGTSWMQLYTASDGDLDGSWLIKVVTNGSSTALGDTVSYCGNQNYETSIGSQSALQWGIRLPHSMYAHRDYLSKVMLYIPDNGAGSYTLGIYCGNTTSNSTLVGTMSCTFAASAEETWQTFTLPTPINISSFTQPLWVTFSTSSIDYPAAGCTFTGDTNSNLIYWNNAWMSVMSIDNSLDYSWMIRAILSNSNAPQITINGPTNVRAGVNATYTVSGPTGAAYSWTLPGAVPATATGTSVTAHWNTAGTYNVMASATYSGTTLRDTLVVHVNDCDIHSFPYHMGFESTDNTDCLTLLDNDGDGYGWGPSPVEGYNHSGNSCYASASYINNIGALTPDNWMVLPQMSFSAGNGYTLTWYDGAIDSNYCNEHYAVYISTTGSSISNFLATTPVFQTTLTTSHYTLRTLDLSAYAGQNVNIAFRHYNSADVYWLLIDDINVAETAVQNYTINVTSANSSMGTVSGGGTYPQGATVTISASAYNGYHFTQWNDGSTANPRTITVTSNATYTAYFAQNDAQNYTINVISANPSMGTVSGGGTYPQGATVTISATAYNGYHFTQWNDGSTANPRTITVTGNATYTAYFAQDEAQTFTINVVSSNQSMGATTGSGTYTAGSTVTIAAVPYTGYYFTQWNDGSTANPRTITVTANATYVANFAANQPQGIDQLRHSFAIASLPGNVISISGVENRTVEIYDITGRLLSSTLCREDLFNAMMPSSGVYLVVVDGLPAQKVVTLR